ncbi:efflux RND transporter permease subunit [Aestuariivita boseongensis]|uniref:efflux RND transporter permease subunit n=1 Tax=Aestuariivita boseongensis TaxID=1470562 RepID=UPI000680DBCC|nr:MMPL family transporter [Aestuariivita boseongensis]
MSAADRITAWIFASQKGLLVTILLLFLALIAGLPHLRFGDDNRNFLGAGNADYLQIQKIEDAYAQSTTTMIMVIPPEGTAFEPATLDALRRMTTDSWQTPYVLRVDSAVNYSHSYAEGEDIIVEPLLEEDVDVTPEMAARFADIAPGSDELVNRLIAADGRAYGISIDVVLPDGVPEARRDVADFLAGQRAEWAADYPGFEFRSTGSVLGGLTLAQAARDDAITLVPLAFVAAIALLALFIRSARAVIASTLIVGAATLATFGVAGWLGIQLTAGTAISPLAVMVLTSASCVHMTLAWIRERETDDPHPATLRALSTNLAPITVATVTTAIGFLGLNFADSPPLREMGDIVAIGLIFGLAAVFVVLPFTLARAAPGSPAPKTLLNHAMMEGLAHRVLATRMVWLIVFPAVIAVSILGITRIGFDDNMLRYFDDRYEFRRDTDAVQERLTGLDSLTFSFEVPDGSVFEPGFLRDIDRFTLWLKEQEHVVSVSSITDIIKRMNKSMSADDPAENRIANSREANAQLMMFYELSLPIGLDLNTQIDVSRLQTRVTAFIRSEHSENLRTLAREAEVWMAQNTPDTEAIAGGYSIAFARITERNNRQMLVGLGVVLALVSLILMLTLRDVKMGAISLVPNLVPALMAFGIWGITFQDVNLGSTVVTTMTFGIVVDDTVHFLMHYLARRKRGEPPQEAMAHTFSVVGAAIIITSIALIVGFAIMALSGFAINQHIGALTAIVIGFALLADLLLLPAVLLRFERTS